MNDSIDEAAAVTTATTRAPATEPSALADEATTFAGQAKSQRTTEEYGKDWAIFTGFCIGHGLDPLPAEAETVALWATHMARSLKPSTVKRRLAAVSAAHKSQGMNSPTTSLIVREVVKGITRAAEIKAAAAGQRPMIDEAEAMTHSKLVQVVGSITGSTNKDIRDRALLLIGFSGYFRRSELAAITVEQIERTTAGIRIHLGQSKTDQEGQATWREIHRSTSVSGPITALDTWLTTAELKTGPLFRAVDRHGNISDKAISDRAVDHIIRTRAENAGFTGISSHSLRRGAAATAASFGAGQLAIARAGGWSHNSKTIARYIEAGTTNTPNLRL